LGTIELGGCSEAIGGSLVYATAGYGGVGQVVGSKGELIFLLN
jgi:hypothetical protein